MKCFKYVTVCGIRYGFRWGTSKDFGDSFEYESCYAFFDEKNAHVVFNPEKSLAHYTDTELHEVVGHGVFAHSGLKAWLQKETRITGPEWEELEENFICRWVPVLHETLLSLGWKPPPADRKSVV